MNHYNLSSGFLHLLSGFRDRYLSTEDAFCGAVRSVSMADRFGESSSRR